MDFHDPIPVLTSTQAACLISASASLARASLFLSLMSSRCSELVCASASTTLACFVPVGKLEPTPERLTLTQKPLKFRVPP